MKTTTTEAILAKQVAVHKAEAKRLAVEVMRLHEDLGSVTATLHTTLAERDALAKRLAKAESTISNFMNSATGMSGADR